MTLEPRATRHSAPAVVAKQRHSTNHPESVPACNRRRSNSCKPSASFLPASVDAKRHLVNTRPRTRVAAFSPRSRLVADRIVSACQRPRRVGYHDGNSHCAFPAQSPRLRDPSAKTGPLQASGESGAMSGSIGVKTQTGWSKTASIGCCSTRRSTHRSRTHGAKMTGPGGHEEKRRIL